MERTDQEWGEYRLVADFGDQLDTQFLDALSNGSFGAFYPQDTTQAGDGPHGAINDDQFFGQFEPYDAQYDAQYDTAYGSGSVRGHAETPFGEANCNPAQPMAMEDLGSAL